MKVLYPEYRKEGITADQLYKKLKKSEQKIIDDFMTLCGGSAGELKLKDIKVNILQFRDILEKDFNDLSIEDLRKFLAVLNKSNKTAYTMNGIKVHIKRFLKWYFKDWSSRFDELRDIKQNSNPFNQKKINEDTIISKDEFQILLKACNNVRDKALLMLFVETGGRPIELRLLKWSDIKFKEGLSEVSLFSDKNKQSRKGFLHDSVRYLKEWKDSTPNNKDRDLVFPSPQGVNKPLSRGAITVWFKKIAKRAGITRNVFPYLMRHSLATELYKKLPSPLASKAMGHNEDMAKVYAHLTNDDLKEAMLKQIYHVEDLTREDKKEINELKEVVNTLIGVIDSLDKRKLSKLKSSPLFIALNKKKV